LRWISWSREDVVKAWWTVGVVVFAAWCNAAAQPSGMQTARDCPTCPEMVLLRGGVFTMGAGPGEEEVDGVPPAMRGRAQPQRQVIVAPFLIGRFEVSRDEFTEFYRATRQKTDNACWAEGQDGKRREYSGFTWRKPGFPQTGRDPVVCVNWFEVRAYASWLSQVTGKRYRLPSEAEWEFAARGGTTGSRPFTADATAFCGRANVGDLSLADAYKHRRDTARYGVCSDGYPFTSPGGAFPANRYGLHDMLGNAWEWTEDCWNPTHDGAMPDHKPRFTGDCDKRVVRGGGWFNEPWRSTVTFRFRDSTGHNGNMLGFRLARDP
jgi:formylglycine-generating enzyme required for sulfatase activity